MEKCNHNRTSGISIGNYQIGDIVYTWQVYGSSVHVYQCRIVDVKGDCVELSLIAVISVSGDCDNIPSPHNIIVPISQVTSSHDAAMYKLRQLRDRCKTHGGKREGAGRKASGKVGKSYYLTLSQEATEHLNSQGRGKSEYIERLIMEDIKSSI